MGVASGMQELVVAGGVESMSRNPMGADKAGLDGHNPNLRRQHPLVPQGISADPIASFEGFHRDDVEINDIYERTQQINPLIVARRILDHSLSMLR